jgi:hypothetical protein
MRKYILGLGLSALLLSTGCNNLQPTRGGTAVGRRPAPQPTAAAMVNYLNENAQRVQGLSSTDVTLECRQDHNSGNLSGRLDCQRPRNFRLTARVVGQPTVDIGSNGEEFWYWISKAEPPYVYHCTYDDLQKPGVFIPFPFQPDMILAALGMAQYDPNKPYEVRANAAARTVELIESATSPQGRPVKKITVFRSGPAGRNEPVVVAHVLKDEQGREVCSATVSEVQTDPATGAVVPRRVRLYWPAEKIELKMKLDGVRVNGIDATLAASLFSRRNLASLTAYDLARRSVDGAPGQTQSFQRVGVPPR